MVVLASFTQPTEGIRHRQNNTTVYVNDNNLGKGTLYIAESRLSWVCDSGSGFSVEYPHISLHAVSRDLSAFPQECLFLMLDTALGDENGKNGDGVVEVENENGNENENGSDEVETTELRLVPDDRGMLDAMFHAMNACQALHPDPEESFSDEDFYEDADDEIPVEETSSQMARLSIENMESRGYIFGRGVGMGVNREVDREVDKEVDREVDREDMEEASGVVNILGNCISAGGDIRVSGAVNILRKRISEEDTEVGTEEGMEEDTEVDTEEGMEMGVEGGRGVGRAVGMAVGTAVGTAVGGVLDRFDIGEDRVEEGVVCTGLGMAQGDRSFSLDSIWHQDRLAQFPPARPHQTDPEKQSNFADSEN